MRAARSTEHVAGTRSSPAHVLGWAAYLACSWTWCIGMFLPVLLVRDFGPWSFAVFAVPNVIGAAAMGWVLREPGASERLVARHAGACEAFSIVTRAFQYFFLVWLATGIGSRGGGLVAIGGMAMGSLLGMRAYHAERGARAGGLATLVISLILLGVAGLRGAMKWPASALALGSSHPDLAWLAPVCALGFVLCPYLDLSFHHARQSRPGRDGTAAFTVGFGVLFLAMIVATLLYAWMFLDPAGLFASDAVRSGAGFLIIAHIGLQLGYTIELHKAEVRVEDSRPRIVQATGFGWGGLGILAGIAAAILPPIAGLSAGEAIYRGFMGFYGLVFPAYVWICVIPTRDGHSGPSRRKLMAWCAAIGIAAPMFWMGFIQRQTWWLGPGLAAILFARLAIMGPAIRRG